MGGTVLKTLNSGDTWTAFSTGSDKWLESIFFLNENKGFIVGEKTILTTINGGSDWVSLGEFSGWIEDIWFFDPLHGIAVGGFPTSGVMSKSMGNDGNMSTSGGAIIWVTSDGGQTWNEKLLNQGGWLLAASFSDLNSGWAVGSDGTIMRYSNSNDIPDQPTNLTGLALSSEKIELSWTDNSDNETGFIIYRRQGLSGRFTQLTSLDANLTNFTDTGFIPGETYWYRVSACNEVGSSSQSMDISVKGPASVVPCVEKINPHLLASIYPNPLNADGIIDFALSDPDHVLIRVYDQNGKLIKALTNQWFPSGHHRLSLAGQSIPKGVYYIHFDTQSERLTIKVLFL